MRQMLREGVLDSITRAESPGGFVSVYAGSDRADPDRSRIESKNAFSRIEAEHEDDEPLLAALDDARAGLEEARLGGYAVAGFVPVGGPAEDALWVALPPEGVAVTVVADAQPFVLPLVALVELFGVAGVATVAQDQIALFQWSQGRLEEIARQSVDVDTMTWRDTQGPFNAVAAGGASGGAGGGAKSTIGSNDAYADKLEHATIAELASTAAPMIRGHAAERGWGRLVWFGSRAITEAIRERMAGERVTHVIGDEAQLLGLGGDDLAERVRAASERRWAQDGDAALRALAERRPADKVETLEEARTLVREGRIGELLITVADAFAVDEDHMQINTLVGEVRRQGGQVRALRADGGDSASPRVAASLRW